MSGPAAARSAVLAGAVTLAAAAGAGCAPPSAIETRPDARAALAGARTVWIAGAVLRSGAAAADEASAAIELAVSGGPAGTAGDTDLRAELESAIRRVRGLELAAVRDRADLVLYFEQADRLRCFRCRQPEGRWYWWGFLYGGDGRELASLHGETTAGREAPARRFIAEVKALTRSPAVR